MKAVPLETPLDGHAYLAAYYDIESDGDLVNLVKELGEWPLIPTSALKDTWPYGSWKESEIVAPNHGDTSICSQNNLEIDHIVESLRAQSLNNLVQFIVEGDDLEEGVLTEVENLANFWPNLQVEFYKKADTVRFTEKKLELLYNCLRSCKNVNLSPFGTMESHALVELVEKLSKSGLMESLTLSGLRQLSKSDMKHLVGCGRSLRQLYILDDVLLSVADLAEKKPSYDIHQHVLLKGPFSVRQDRSALYSASHTHSPPSVDFSHEGVIQPILHMAWVGTSEVVYETKKPYNSDGNFNWDCIKHATELPIPGGRLRGHYIFCRKLPMVNIPLPLKRLTVGFQNFLQWYVQNSAVS